MPQFTLTRVVRCMEQHSISAATLEDAVKIWNGEMPIPFGSIEIAAYEVEEVYDQYWTDEAGNSLTEAAEKIEEAIEEEIGGPLIAIDGGTFQDVTQDVADYVRRNTDAFDPV